MAQTTPQEITDFWIREVGQERWYASDPELDAEIRRRFEPAWHEARARHLCHWRCGPPQMLAYLVLTDQFPRNMFRDTPEAFATDGLARSAAKQAIDARWDLQTPEPQRQFFYMPLVHSENAGDQERAVRLLQMRMPETGAGNLLHARVHRELIRRYGRFPSRNAALSRDSSDSEQAFLSGGGYREVLEQLSA